MQIVLPVSWWPFGSRSSGPGREDRRSFQLAGISIEASVTEGEGERVATMWAISLGCGEADLEASDGIGLEKIPRLSSGHCVRR